MKKLKQKTGLYKLTQKELEKVHRVKAPRRAWFQCRMCNHLGFLGSNIKYYVSCGYDALDKIVVEIIKEEI